VNPEDDPQGLLQSLLSGYRRIRENPLGDIAMGFTPAGVVADVEDAGRAIRDRDLVGLGLAGIGFVPGVGDVAKGAGKAIRRAVSDLPMDEASRLARAREMGFDVDNRLYHGTSRDIESFRPGSMGDIGPGIYLTNSPDVAKFFAGDIDDPWYIRGGSGPNVMPLLTRLEKTYELQDRYGIRDLFPSPYTKDKVIEELMDSGYDSIRLRNAGLRGEDYINVLDPSKIRSTSAVFDPTQRESANLLAGLAGLFGAGTAARMMDQNREER